MANYRDLGCRTKYTPLHIIDQPKVDVVWTPVRGVREVKKILPGSSTVSRRCLQFGLRAARLAGNVSWLISRVASESSGHSSTPAGTVSWRRWKHFQPVFQPQVDLCKEVSWRKLFKRSAWTWTIHHFCEASIGGSRNRNKTKMLILKTKLIQPMWQ